MENLLFKHIEKYSGQNKTYIDFILTKYTYKQLYSDILKITSLFYSYRINDRSKIVILSDNQKESISIFLSALCNQICVVFLPTDINNMRLKQILEDVEPSLIFVDSNLSVQYETQKIIRVDNEDKNGNLFKKLFNKQTSNTFPSILANYETKTPQLNIDDNSNAYIIYTSGTTTSPKGVVHTHKSYFSHLLTLIKVYSYTNKSIIFNNLDLSHSDGMLHGPVLSAVVGLCFLTPILTNYLQIIYNILFYRYSSEMHPPNAK